MMHDPWTDRLSEYVDAELAPTERAACEAHLRACADCRAVVADLRGLVAAARALPGLPPSRDLWPAIAAQTQDVVPLASRRPRALPSWVRLAAAAALFLALGSAATWLALSPRGGTAPAVATGPVATTAAARPAAAATRGTDAAVAELEQVLAAGSARLDTQTVRVVAENLARIDSAIAEAHRALESDPSNVYVSRHLAGAEKRKLALLRTAVRLVQSQS
jgi:anti-sigma factor RsiW